MSIYEKPGKYFFEHPDPTAEEALKNIQRRASGALARMNGIAFENIIEASLIWYEQKGLVCMKKTPEPMRPISRPNKKGQFLACYEKKAQADFGGTLYGGRSVKFEAKHTESDKIEASRLTDEQEKDITKHHNLGAAAFVVVSFGLTDFYRIPWEVWRDMKKLFGYKHMKKKDCEPYRVEYIAGVIKLLDGIELKYNERKEERA